MTYQNLHKLIARFQNHNHMYDEPNNGNFNSGVWSSSERGNQPYRQKSFFEYWNL